MASNHPPNHQSDTNPSTSTTTPYSRPTSRTITTTSTSTTAYGGDTEIECSHICCKSCVSGAIADGVAICCCPCAVVDLVAFVLIRVPWMVGQRCLKMVRGKQKRKRRIAECGGGNGGETRRRSSGMSRNYLESWRVSEGMIEVTTSFKFEEDENDDDSDDRVWLELCRGFGRLSFTSIQSAGKGS